MKQEIEFKGSNLETTLKHLKDHEVDIHYDWTKYALKCQPESKFWQEAFELIENRFNKLKK